MGIFALPNAVSQDAQSTDLTAFDSGIPWDGSRLSSTTGIIAQHNVTMYNTISSDKKKVMGNK